MKNIKNIINSGAKSIYIIFVLLFLIIGMVMYFLPKIFLFLFTNILGNLLLITLVGSLFLFDIMFAIGVGIIFIIIFMAIHLGFAGKKNQNQNQNQKQGFTGIPQYMQASVAVPGGWPQDIINKFLAFQGAHNPNVFFDMKIIQQQASADEVRQFLKDGKWPWSKEVQRLFQQAVAENSYISTNPGTSMMDAQTVYNENAMKQLLSWNTKEGDFLLGGVTIGHSADSNAQAPKFANGIPKNLNNTIRCAADTDGNTVMQKTIYTGYNGVNGAMSHLTSVVPPDQIPVLVPGFSFIEGKGVCNPCVPLNSPPDYSCPFIIDTGNGTEISDIWLNLWGMGTKTKTSSSKRFATYDTTNNSYLLGVSRKNEEKNVGEGNPKVLNENTNMF